MNQDKSNSDSHQRSFRIPRPHDGENFTIIPGSLAVPLVLTCEHATSVIPPEYADLGLRRRVIDQHWGWDLGIWATVLRSSSRPRLTAIATQVSRLLIDTNRHPDSPELIVEALGEQPIPGNCNLSRAERQARLKRYHEPYHAAVERVLETALDYQPSGVLLIAMHSFTPEWEGQDRDFDVGLLFRDSADAARKLGDQLTREGLRVRENEPYSGLRGEIYSCERHGRAHGIPHFEVELNQAILNSEAQRRKLGDLLARVLPALAQTTCQRD